MPLLTHPAQPVRRDGPAPMPRAAATLLGTFALFVAASLATRWFGLVVEVLDIDETAHAVGSWEVLAGRTLYAEFVDNKPPLLYAYYLLAQAVCGFSLPGVRLFTMLLTVPLTAMAVSAFFDHDRRGRLAGLLFIVYGAAYLAHDMLAAHAETLMALPGASALVLVRDRARAMRPARQLAAGVLLGLGVLLKYQVGLWAAACGLALLAAAWRDDIPAPLDTSRGMAGRAARLGRTLPPLVALSIGFAIPLAATWAVFDAWGAADDLAYWTLANNASYTNNPIALGEASERALSYALPWMIVTAPLWWGAWRSRHAHGEPYRVWLLALLLACTAVAACLGWRFFPHYFIQFYVPLALAAAPWLALRLQRPLDRGGRRFVAWTAAVLVVSVVVNVALYFGPRRVYRETDPVYRLAAERLRRDPCAPGATMFVWGYAPNFYYEAHIPAASRFVVMTQARLTPYLSGNLASVRGEIPAGNVIVPAHWDWLMGDLEARRATFILDTAPAGINRWNRYPVRDYPRLDAYLREQFDFVDSVGSVAIYRRRGCESAGARITPAPSTR